MITCALAAALVLALAAPAQAREWLAGDLHVHTTYSHDSYGGPTDDNTGPEDGYALGFPVQGQFANAAARGLDFLAISDHNDIRSQTDPGFGFGGVIPVRAYENSLDGHAQMLGAARLYDNGDQSTAAVAALAAALRADGGLLQVNHPSDPLWGYGYDVRPDTVEVWNLPRVYQPPLPSSSDNDQAVRYWEGWLDRGERVAATGGSDSHWVSTSAAQGPGQPTTWVLAEERSERGVLEGIRRGRTFISGQPPRYAGARLFLEGDLNRDGHYETPVGGVLPPGAPLRARVENAPGAMLRVVSSGGQEAFRPVTVTSPAFEHRFHLSREVEWARAEVYGEDLQAERAGACEGTLGGETTYCRNRIALLAMTSAIYFR
jgi:hypothetical protein